MKSLLVVLATIGASSGFVAPKGHQRLRQRAAEPPSSFSTGATELYSHKLVLVRHGESTWNDLNIFTGWADAELNEKGLREAAQGGELLREGGYTFDVAYTSVLKRAIKTLWIILEELDLMYIPIVSCRNHVTIVSHRRRMPVFLRLRYAMFMCLHLCK